MKEGVIYERPLPANVEKVKTQITTVIHTVTPDRLQNVWNEFDYRVDVIRAFSGGLVENL